MGGITKGRDVAPLRVPVMLARETVTGLVMEVSMMGTEAAWLDWCAGPTTVSSSVSTIMRKTTAVRNPPEFSPSQPPQ